MFRGVGQSLEDVSPFSTQRSCVLLVKRVVPHAILPCRQSADAAGYDLACSEPVINLKPGDRICVSTGLSMEIPKGHYGRIAPRSGLAVKNGIQVGAGVIDSDYRGVVAVLLFNHGKDPVNILRGSRIAQLIIEKISTPLVVEVNEHSETVRGDGGFGSTGVTSEIPKS